MTGIRRSRLTVFLGAVLCTLLVSMTVHAQDASKEHAFKGVVQKVDAKAKSLTVDGENVQGWMMAMTMAYGADKDDIFKTVKAGDQITAKVYDGDFKTLYDVRVVPPKSSSAPPKK
jgi:Cu/Ag efflux protein CusF